MKKIVEFKGHLPRVFIPKNEIDPVVNVSGHLRRLEHLPHFKDKLLGALCPPWELHIVHFLLVLLYP